MTDDGLNPRDLELVAAFIDRRLDEEERRAFMSRLDSEEELYEVFVETVRYRDQQAGGGALVVEHPASRRRWGRLAAIAALVAIAVATPLVLRNLPDAGYAPRLAADGALGGVLGEGWLLKGWSEMRGATPGTDEFDTAFRLGVRQVDLEVALRLERAADAQRLAAEMERRLGGVRMAEPYQLLYAEVADLAGEPARALELAEPAGRELVDFLGETVGVAFELGMWTEAGVLAARSGNTELLGSRAFRRGLDRFRGESWPTLAADLETIASLLEALDERPDLARLEAAFTAIVDRS